MTSLKIVKKEKKKKRSAARTEAIYLQPNHVRIAPFLLQKSSQSELDILKNISYDEI